MFESLVPRIYYINGLFFISMHFQTFTDLFWEMDSCYVDPKSKAKGSRYRPNQQASYVFQDHGESALPEGESLFSALLIFRCIFFFIRSRKSHPITHPYGCLLRFHSLYKNFSFHPFIMCLISCFIRADSRFAPSQWETLQSNAVSQPMRDVTK